MKKILFTLGLYLWMNVGDVFAEPLNMAYVGVNSNNLSNVACYVRADTNKPFFQIASIFAANINGSDPNKPIIYFNPHVDSVLNHSDQVDKLQKQGIKVLLSILGNHENAGWSCMTNSTAIQQFANQLVDITNKYHLDGIDIDDEYSKCLPNDTSMIKISRAIKMNPAFKGKILTKALFNDSTYFKTFDAGNRLADFLDHGWEMSYWSSNFNERLNPYLNYGMMKNTIWLGVDSNSTYPSPESAAHFIMQNSYQGVMVFDITNNSQNYLTRLAEVEYRTSVQVLPKCLK